MDDSNLAPGAVPPLPATPGTSPTPVPCDIPRPTEIHETELFPENGAPASNSSRKKVDAASAGVFARFGEYFKRGRGRPRKDGAPKISDVVLPTPPAGVVSAPAGGGAPSGGPDNTGIIRAACLRVAKATAAFFDRMLGNRALVATNDPQFAAQIVKETTALPEELDAFADLAALAIAEMKLQVKWVPVVAAGTVLAGGVMRYGLAMKGVNAMLAEKMAGQNPPPPAEEKK
jgi:hypothetical protein